MKYLFLALFLTGCASSEIRAYHCAVDRRTPFGGRTDLYFVNSTSSGNAEDLLRTLVPNAEDIRCGEYYDY